MGLKDRAGPVLRLKSVRPGWVLSSHHVFCFLFFIQLKINSWEPDADGNTDCEQLPRSQSEQRLASSPGNGAHMRTAVPAPDSQQGPQDSCLADPSSPMPGTSPTGHLIYVQQVFNLDRKNSQLWGKVRILNVLKHDAINQIFGGRGERNKIYSNPRRKSLTQLIFLRDLPGSPPYLKLHSPLSSCSITNP